ncbi:uncharacterized protein A1O9_11716 [Exophiala aquamarina CBS 119918]|uniref:Uncharacterized protein n=1 Tax=Exophiala aquamarina CBS 119918 TaxID=1182545 RepID=A0A072P919_9EURO|nr:uncharacterized protein A1O9_11716 [Exophiala aquamarina CBS 119918]KEF52090.1 hypothetical protein A1O9_11716 [Exophiala aquamarina CBS 119918]
MANGCMKGPAGKELLKTTILSANLSVNMWLPYCVISGQQALTSPFPRGNDGMRHDGSLWHIMGMLEPTVDARIAISNEIPANTSAGQQRQGNLREVLDGMHRDENGLSIKMKQRYVSAAVFQSNQDERPKLNKDPQNTIKRPPIPVHVCRTCGWTMPFL